MKFLLVGIMLLLVLAGVVVLVLQPYRTAAPSVGIHTATTTIATTTAPAAFSADGYLVRDNPGQKPGVWYLLYERPSAPALTLELLFDRIPTPPLSAGARVHVEGSVSGSVLSVSAVSPLASSTSDMAVVLYYYDPALDQGPGGVQCSSRGLTPVERVIPKTQRPLYDTISLLLRGELSPDERARGITTEFPLPGVSLTFASIQGGTATLTFADPEHKTGGGSCRAAVLWAQIQATARQFSSVERVRFLPEDLFQP